MKYKRSYGENHRGNMVERKMEAESVAHLVRMAQTLVAAKWPLETIAVLFIS
jgi:FixJ family two-component response regulator